MVHPWPKMKNLPFSNPCNTWVLNPALRCWAARIDYVFVGSLHQRPDRRPAGLYRFCEGEKEGGKRGGMDRSRITDRWKNKPVKKDW